MKAANMTVADDITRTNARRGRIIAIASGKGGVGKTWFAITLAHAMALRGGSVLLFDADLGLANVDIQLGLSPQRDLGNVLMGSCTMAEACLRHEAGFSILPGRSGSGDLAVLHSAHQSQVTQLLFEAGAQFASVIVDLGAGLDAFVRMMAKSADQLLILATDEPTSLTDAYAVLKLYQRDLAPQVSAAQIVVNQAASRSAGERTYATLARASEAFLHTRPSLCGIVRRDEHVRDAIRRQAPLLTRHPSSEAAQDVVSLAARL